MANAFTLFGVLRADASNFVRGMRAADSELQNFDKKFEQSVKKRESFNQKYALQEQRLAAQTAQLKERLAQQSAQFQQKMDLQVQKMAQQTEAQRMRLAQQAYQFQVRQSAQAAKQIEAEQRRIAKASQQAAEQLKKSLSNVGSGLSSIGKTLSVGITAPLIAATAGLIKLGAGFDALRNKMTAATGSTEAANKKIAELRQLAQNSAGVLSDAAVDLYTFFKPMGIGDSVIDELIKSFGRLKLANEEIDLKQFGRNLTQLFTQGFERTDLKELIGAFPRAGEILQQAFNLSGSDLDTIAKEMKAKIASGLSKEDFFGAIANAINKDANLSKLGDTIGIRFQKALDRVYVALEPLAQTILNAIEPLLPPIIAFIEQLGAAFASLSPYVQTAIVAIAGIAAAIGPLLVVIASVITAITTVIASFGTIAIVAGVVAGAIIQLTVPLAALSAGIYALYTAWETNFAGIRDLTEIVANAVQSAWNSALTTLSQFTNQILSEIQAFWKENGAAIMLSVREVGNFIRSFWQAALASLSAIWREYGDEIKAIASAVWEAVKTIVKTGMNAILGIIQVVSGIINGDWSSVWEGAKRIFRAAWEAIKQFAKTYVDIVKNIIRGLIEFIVNLGITAYNSAWSLGENIGKGLHDGLMSWLVAAKDAIVSFITQSNAAKGVAYGALEGTLNLPNSGGSATLGGGMSGGGGGGGTGGGKGRGGGGKGKGGGGSTQESAYQQLLKSLEKEIALTNAVTREQKLQIDLQFDKEYAKISEAQKQVVLGKARLLDAFDAEKKALEETKDVINEINRAYADAFEKPKTNVQSFFERLNKDTKNFLAEVKTAAGLFATFQKANMADAKKAFEDGRPEPLNLEKIAEMMRNNPIKASGADIVQVYDTELEFTKLTKWQEVIQRIQEKLGDLTDDTRTAGQVLGDVFVGVLGQIENIFSSAVTSANGFFSGLLDGFKNFAKQIIAEMMAVLAVAAIVGAITAAFGGSFMGGFKSVTGSGQGGIGGGIIGSIFNRSGGGSGGHSGGSPFPDLAGIGDLDGYASGGFTGFGNPNDIAGIVHKNEYVASAADVRAAGGASAMEKRVKGGGAMNVNATINVYGVTDAPSFQRSQRQIVRGLTNQIQAEMARES